jgi:hypothetical protein
MAVSLGEGKPPAWIQQKTSLIFNLYTNRLVAMLPVAETPPGSRKNRVPCPVPRSRTEDRGTVATTIMQKAYRRQDRSYPLARLPEVERIISVFS